MIEAKENAITNKMKLLGNKKQQRKTTGIKVSIYLYLPENKIHQSKSID